MLFCDSRILRLVIFHFLMMSLSYRYLHLYFIPWMISAIDPKILGTKSTKS